MTAKDKHKLFDQLCLDAHWLDVVCRNNKGSALPTEDEVNEVIRLAKKVTDSAMAFDQAMHNADIGRAQPDSQQPKP